MEKTMTALLERRNDVTRKLINAIAHLPVEQQITIITSYFSIDELEKIADFQAHCSGE